MSDWIVDQRLCPGRVHVRWVEREGRRTKTGSTDDRNAGLTREGGTAQARLPPGWDRSHITVIEAGVERPNLKSAFHLPSGAQIDGPRNVRDDLRKARIVVIVNAHDERVTPGQRTTDLPRTAGIAGIDGGRLSLRGIDERLKQRGGPTQ